MRAAAAAAAFRAAATAAAAASGPVDISDEESLLGPPSGAPSRAPSRAPSVPRQTEDEIAGGRPHSVPPRRPRSATSAFPKAPPTFGRQADGQTMD